MNIKKEEVSKIVKKAVDEVQIVDLHTHIFDLRFKDLLLWGIDDLLTYHYLIAEVMRFSEMPYDEFWKMTKTEQANLIWKTLFIENSPLSEAARGVITVLKSVGLDPSKRDIDGYRRFFASKKVEEYIDIVFKTAHIKYVVMTNDPFVEDERKIWIKNEKGDIRFKSALRIDPLLVKWPSSYLKLREWGYDVEEKLTEKTFSEIKRFLSDWIDRMNPLYMAASLPPEFKVPSDTETALIIENAIIPVSYEHNIPFAMMIGAKKLTNPQLKLAGDSVGKADINTVEYLARMYPHNKFLITMLSKENQHELVVAARKFRNIHVFGCWWFLNNPSIVDEITRERMEMLGLSFTPQHSDARVLDQLIYKWDHSKKVIEKVLIDKYLDILEDGWTITEEEVKRDVEKLFGGEFEAFLKRRF
ncbi:glucuronate isomerase [Athalassotoga saccharophila]|uniref:glucuronate isomerase n=1 Tax=Athalassotoga saccharophila TaxID=1441386 RepID=UPI00137A7D46|nr:glucuronate isomerase [Athalassotoga saccharophila]BBJ27801.1 uronate isomerase [Athalassotoga saccharophila]